MKLKGICFAFLMLICFYPKAQQKPAKSADYLEFVKALDRAGIQFTLPEEFKEVKIPYDENVSFDFGLRLDRKDFEVWYIVNNLKGDWLNYENSKGDSRRGPEIPDSSYRRICKDHAVALAGEDNYNKVDMPESDLKKHFNADVGKAYALNLYDSPLTKHYKYALLLMVQKNRKANVLMLFLSNDNGPEFYNNVNKAYNSIRFK